MFENERERTFNDSIEILFRMNEGDMLNCFNLRYLSLPVEHSLQYNYWAFFTLKSWIKEQYKNKILNDIALIASTNGIVLPSFSF